MPHIIYTIYCPVEDSAWGIFTMKHRAVASLDEMKQCPHYDQHKIVEIHEDIAMAEYAEGDKI